MELDLLCTKDVTFLLNMYDDKKRQEVIKGDIVRAKINNKGIKFLLNNVWTYEYSIREINRYFTAI